MSQIEPTRVDSPPTLSVSEFFYSIQGEGGLAGLPCAFVRLAGCHLACTWCDATYTWKPGVASRAGHARLTIDQIVQRLDEYRAPMVEVTGGEPLLQPATPDLLRTLCDRWEPVVLDTSGALSIAEVDPRVRIVMDLKCPGSGQTEHMHWPNLDLLKPGLDEIKFVILDRADYEWAAHVTRAHRLWDRFRVVYQPATPAGFNGDMAAWPLPRQLALWMLADRSRAVLQLQCHRLLWPAAVTGAEEGYE